MRSWADYDIPAMLSRCDALIAEYDADLRIIERALWKVRPIGEEMQTVFRFVRDDEGEDELWAKRLA